MTPERQDGPLTHVTGGVRYESDKEPLVTSDLLPLRLIKFPNDLLVARNWEVKEVNDEVKEKVVRMFEILYQSGNGIGLAAPQVGWNAQLFILNLDPERKKSGEMVFINPRIVEVGGDEEMMVEGCLSFPGIFASIRRYTEATVVSKDLAGQLRDVKYQGLGAQALQHETEHCEGMLFIEKMSPADKKLNEPKIKQLVENYWRRNKK